jgi:hypothetical protein
MPDFACIVPPATNGVQAVFFAFPPASVVQVFIDVRPIPLFVLERNYSCDSSV